MSEVMLDRESYCLACRVSPDSLVFHQWVCLCQTERSTVQLVTLSHLAELWSVQWVKLCWTERSTVQHLKVSHVRLMSDPWELAHTIKGVSDFRAHPLQAAQLWKWLESVINHSSYGLFEATSTYSTNSNTQVRGLCSFLIEAAVCWLMLGGHVTWISCWMYMGF